MSATEPAEEPPPLGYEVPGVVGELYSLPFYDDASLVDEATDEAEAKTVVSRVIVNAQKSLSPELAQIVSDTWGVVEQSWDEGEITYNQTGDFFRWLRYDKGVVVLTAALVTGGALAAHLLDYAELHGYKPPTPRPKPTPVVPPKPTPGQKVVGRAASRITPQYVTAPELSKAEAAAISKAIGVAAADSAKLVAATVDEMLPGMAPGQVPAALTDLFTASHVLEHDVTKLMAEVHPGAPASLVGTTKGLQKTVHGLAQEVHQLAEDLAEKAPSTLHTHVQNNTEAIDDLRTNVHEINTVSVPELAGAVGTLVGTVGALDTLVKTDLAPTLSRVEQEATQSAYKLALTTDECLADLCDAENNVTNPIKEGGATPSLLKGLGGLLGAAFGLTTLVGLLETLATVLDAKLAVSAMVSDVEQLSGWAELAATTVTGELSQIGPLGG